MPVHHLFTSPGLSLCILLSTGTVGILARHSVEDFKDAHAGKEAFVLGTGPSLTDVSIVARMKSVKRRHTSWARPADFAGIAGSDIFYL